MRKLPLSSVVVTKHGEDSRVHLQHRIGPFKASKLQEKKVLEAQQLGCHEEKKRKHATQVLRKDLCKLICMKEYCVQTGL